MKPLRVLLVEDNEDNRTVYRTILEHFGYSVIEARNGEDGIRMAREDHPDLILMDLSLPVMDGWTATRHLKADPATRHIPVIALSAHAMSGDREKALEAGCDDYHPKPVDFSRLLEQIDAALLAGDAEPGAEGAQPKV